MKNLIVSTYPKNQSTLRQRLVQKFATAEKAYLKSAARAGHGLLDLTGKYANYPESLRFLPLEFSDSTLSRKAETAASEIAEHWLEDVSDLGEILPWPEARRNRLFRAIESELFRVLLEFVLSVLVTRNAIETLSPERITFLDPAMAAVFEGDYGDRVKIAWPGRLFQSLDFTVECLRLIRESQAWAFPRSTFETSEKTEFLFFSDSISHARVLAPVARALGVENCAVVATDLPSVELYESQGISPVVPTRRPSGDGWTGEAKALLDLTKALADERFLARRDNYRVFRSAHVRMQVVLLLLQGIAFEKLWEAVLHRTQPRAAIVSIAVWPSYRLLLDLARERGLKTAVVMHGNIPEYPPYYAYPKPDLYCLFGDVYRNNLLKCGQNSESLVNAGCLVPESVETPEPERAAVDGNAPPKIVFLHSVAVCEINWLSYWKSIETFVHVAAKRPEWRFVVKLHPSATKEESEFLEYIRRYRTENVEFVQFVPVRECLKDASVAVSTFSTTVLDSLALGVPVVILRPEGDRSLMPFCDMGLAEEATDAFTLEEKLSTAIGNRSRTSIETAMAGFCSCRGDEALARTVGAIRDLLGTGDESAEAKKSEKPLETEGEK